VTNLTDSGVLLLAPPFRGVDAQPYFVIICDYTGKEVVE
jgi:hypothetical protein